jgi:hypothetical protein
MGEQKTTVKRSRHVIMGVIIVITIWLLAMVSMITMQTNNEYPNEYDSPMITIDLMDRFRNLDLYPHQLLEQEEKILNMLGEPSPSVSHAKDESKEGGNTLLYLNQWSAMEYLVNDEGPDYHNNMSSTNPFSIGYPALLSGWDVQLNLAYCGVATAVTIINSYRWSETEDETIIPVDPIYQPYRYATQHDIFNECTQANVIHQPNTIDYKINGISQLSSRGGRRDHWGIDGIETAPYGLNLRQVEKLLKCHLLSFDNNATSTDREGTIEYDIQSKTPSSVSEMREDLKAVLKQKSGRVVININRHAMGQVGGGHFSPLASYSTARDAFLFLDVAKYKYPPVWVPSNTLFHAIVDVPDSCGIWNFPEAQEQLGNDLRLPKTNTQFLQAKAIVGCTSSPRGYITIQRNMRRNTGT